MFPDEMKGTLKGCWERIVMGFGPSPYQVTKEMLVVEKRVRGATLDHDNVFRWYKVIFNLLGIDKYDSSRP